MLVLYSQGHEWKVSCIKGNIIEMYSETKTGALLLRSYDIVNATYHNLTSFETYPEGTVYGSTGSKVGDIECGVIKILFEAKILPSKLVQVLNQSGIELPKGSKIIQTWGGGYRIVDKETNESFDTWEDVLIGYELDNYNFGF